MSYEKLLVAIAALMCAVSVAYGAPAQSNKGHYERVTVHGESLVGNLAADPPDRPVSVYLPPSYAKEPRRRYPVLYLLHGFTDSDTRWFGQAGKHFVNVPNAVDAAYAAGVTEMIVVMPNAFTKFQGSMYANSVVVGDWETFISRELVADIDARYRTLANPASRGLAGHSMGGYGTLRIAMKAPGVFSTLYVTNACCLAPIPEMVPAMFERAAKIRTAEEIGAADFITKAMLASAAAWSPNPKNPPLFIDLPATDGKLDRDVVAAWSANAPITMLHQYIPALKSYRAIAIDAGDKDEVSAPASTQVHALLDRYAIAHEFEIYDGDHTNRIESRLTTKVLPFFAARLKSR